MFIRNRWSILSEKTCKRKINFLQSADNDFYDTTFKDYIWYIVQRNDQYSSKENRVREMHRNKQALQSF